MRKITHFVGSWQLVGSTHINSQVKFYGNTPDPIGVSNWINGDSNELADEVSPTEGLVLTITENAKFSEDKTGNPKTIWYDLEGVQSDVEPFSGWVSLLRSKIYLMADGVPDWGNTPDAKKLRYNDGDTKIADTVEVDRKKQRLIRCMNIVTDDLYLDRIILVYKPAG